MNPIGAKARTNLTEIVRSAMSEDDYAAAAHAGIAQEALMLARVSALHFIATNEQGGDRGIHPQDTRPSTKP